MRHVGDFARLQQTAALLEVRHDDIGGAFFENLAETPAHVYVRAATDGCARGCAYVPHGVDVFGRNRFLQPHQLERLDFLGNAFAGTRVIAPVHVDGQIEVLGIKLAGEGDLRNHVVDLAVRRRPVHAVEARGISRVVDIHLGSRETHLLDLPDSCLGAVVAGDHLPRAGIAVNAHALAYLAAQQLIYRQAQSLTRKVPKRDFDCRQRGDILAGLRAGKDAGGADAFESSLDIERVLANQHARERIDDWHVACRSIRGFALTDDALIGIDPDVDLVAVH